MQEQTIDAVLDGGLAFLREPADVLLTPPESLEAMFVSARVAHEPLFAHLQAIVVDEVHAFAGDDRGGHLSCVMERIGRLAGRDVQRIGLSAERAARQMEEQRDEFAGVPADGIERAGAGFRCSSICRAARSVHPAGRASDRSSSPIFRHSSKPSATGRPTQPIEPPFCPRTTSIRRRPCSIARTTQGLPASVNSTPT